MPRLTYWIGFAVGALGVAFALPAHAQDQLDRTVLPIQVPKPPLYTELDARRATPPPFFPG